MSGYIYNIYDYSQLDGRTPQFASTRKYEARRFLKQKLDEGTSLALFEVTRSRDGVKDTITYVDPYEFMQIDLGEVL